MKRSTLFAVVLAASVAAAAPSAAQQLPPQQVIGFNPIGFIFRAYSVEYERVMGQSTTIGLAGSHFRGEDDVEGTETPFRWTTLDAKFRFYPGGQPMRRFSFGGSAGFVSARETTSVGTQSETQTTGAVGLEVSYQWLLGLNDNFAVALGLGAKRTFLDEADLRAVPQAWPYLRLNVGYAF